MQDSVKTSRFREGRASRDDAGRMAGGHSVRGYMNQRYSPDEPEALEICIRSGGAGEIALSTAPEPA